MKTIYLNAVKNLVLFILLVLSSCGMEGDLYLPENDDKPSAQETSKGS